MLIRLLILSAFVLLVHLVVGMFARDLKHEMTRRAAKDEATDPMASLMSRRRQLVMQQHTVKRAVSPKTVRRHRDGDEELLRAEESAYAGALVNEGEGNATVSANQSKVVGDPLTNVSSVTNDEKNNQTATESKEASSTPVTRKRRPVPRATESSVVSSHLPVAAALTMSESLYNHFHPMESELPEDQFLPFLQFGKKLIPISKTTFPATVTSSTNALDSVTNSPRAREYSSFNPTVEDSYQAPATKPRLSEEEINEDMDVAILKPVVEKNKATRGKTTLLSLRNVGGLYRKQLETNENLVISSDKNSINDTGAKVNDTKYFERKRLPSVIAEKKEVIVDSNGRRKIVAVSRRPVLTNVTSSITTTSTTPSTSAAVSTPGDKEEEGVSLQVNSMAETELPTTLASTSYTTAQPTTPSTVGSTTTTTTTTVPATDSTAQPIATSTSRTSTVTRAVTTTTATVASTTTTTPTTSSSTTSAEHLIHDPTLFSSSNVVAARTVPQRTQIRNSTGLAPRRRTSPLYNTGKRSNPLRTSLMRHISTNSTELDMAPEESNISTSFTPSITNGSSTEAIKNQTITRLPSIIEKNQQLRMADRAGRRQSRQNYTDILRTNKYIHSAQSESSVFNDSLRAIRNTSDNVESSTVSTVITEAPQQNLSSTGVPALQINYSASSEPPTTSTSTLLIPTTKILSTAVVTSVSIKGAWTAGVTEMPPHEVFPAPPPVKEVPASDVDQKPLETILEVKATDTQLAGEVHNQTVAYPTAPGNATYSMIKDLLAEINTPEVQVGTRDVSYVNNPQLVVNTTEIGNVKAENITREVLPLIHEHFVGVDSPRPVFTNSSVVYTTSYSRNEPPVQIQTAPPVQSMSDDASSTSLPVVSTTTTTTTTTTTSTVPRITVAPPSSSALPPSSTVTQVPQSTSSSSPPPSSTVNAPVYQEPEQNLSKGRALWTNTTSRPSTKIPVAQSSDKDFDLPLVKLYNSSTAWSDAVPTTEETQYDTANQDYDMPTNLTDQDYNDTVVDVNKCSGNQGCPENDLHSSTSRRPLLIKDCDGLNSSREGCGSRPRESGVSVAESTSGIEMAIYVLAGICVIPAAVGALFLVRCVLRHRRKVLDESDTCSEISCHRAGENGEATTPASTKLPRLQPHMGWEQEKSPTSPPAVPDGNNRWEFPRSMLRLQTVLGQGNFGQVLKAEADDLSGHPGTTRLVAVKLVKEGATTREKEDLLRELEIMKQLGAHPNVVTLLGCCTEQEPYLLIMEYVMYGKLLTFLRDHRTRQNYYNFSEDSDALTSRDLTVFGYCVARGMEYLVSKGIIHRDLAARNVLVDHNKLCKIADFGMSRTVRELGEIYEQRQTKGALPIRWMAPESLLYRVFTHKSDVWSFGILMWEIVTLGSTPYPTMGAREVMKRVREGYRLERPSHCRPELFRVISHCWNSDPAKRPDFTELKRELGTLVEDARQGKYVDLDRFAEYSGGRNTALHSGGDPELIHM